MITGAEVAVAIGAEKALIHAEAAAFRAFDRIGLPRRAPIAGRIRARLASVAIAYVAVGAGEAECDERFYRALRAIVQDLRAAEAEAREAGAYRVGAFEDALIAIHGVGLAGLALGMARSAGRGRP